MVQISTPPGGDFVNKLRKIIELPENITHLEIHANVDDFVTVTCTYYPALKTAEAADGK